MSDKGKNKKGVSGHPEIRKKLTEFLKNTAAYQFQDGQRKRRDPTASGWRIGGGTFFLVTEDIRNLQIKLSKLIERRIGHEGLRRSEIDAIIWEEVAGLVLSFNEAKFEEKIKEAVKRLLEAIDTGSTEHVSQFFPCPVVRDLSSLKPLVVGPVSILNKKTFDQEVKQLGAAAKGWSKFPSNFVWSVQTRCALSSSRVQAEWLIDICCGFLTIFGEHALPFDFYRPGWQLAHPTEPQERLREDKGIIEERPFYQKSMYSYFFIFDENYVDRLGSKDTSDKSAALFHGDFDSVGGRLGAAFGWLSRGLRASNSETRLLFFSTALETILVAGRKGITDQLARNAACVLTDDIDTRFQYASLLREFYELRSILVHEGDRRVYRSEVNDIEFMTIEILHQIWTKADLTMSFRTLVQDMKKCSFGTPMQWSGGDHA